MDRPQTAPGTMRGWHNRRTGETVESLATLCEQTASKSQALIWYVNVDSRVPVRVQLAILWLKRLFGVKL